MERGRKQTQAYNVASTLRSLSRSELTINELDALCGKSVHARAIPERVLTGIAARDGVPLRMAKTKAATT